MIPPPCMKLMFLEKGAVVEQCGRDSVVSGKPIEELGELALIRLDNFNKCLAEMWEQYDAEVEAQDEAS